MIFQMEAKHWKEMLEIYQQGIDLGIATFNTVAPDYKAWDESHIKKCRYVYLIDNKVCGWITLSAISIKDAYQGAAEVSIYVHNDFKGRGIGKKLMKHMMVESEKNGFWTLESKIITDNEKSVALHKACGFREVGVREKIARDKDRIWRDFVIMEKRNSIM